MTTVTIKYSVPNDEFGILKCNTHLDTCKQIVNEFNKKHNFYTYKSKIVIGEVFTTLMFTIIKDAKADTGDN